MEPFTITPKLSLEAVSSVVLPNNLPVKAATSLVAFALAGAGTAFFRKLEVNQPPGGFAAEDLMMALMGLSAIVSGLSFVVLVTVWLARFWLYERVLKATAARGPVTVSDEGLELYRDPVWVHVPWDQIKSHKTSDLAVMLVTDANEHVILPTSDLVEMRVFADLSRCLEDNARPEEPTDSL